MWKSVYMCWNWERFLISLILTGFAFSLSKTIVLHTVFSKLNMRFLAFPDRQTPKKTATLKQYFSLCHIRQLGIYTYRNILFCEVLPWDIVIPGFTCIRMRYAVRPLLPTILIPLSVQRGIPQGYLRMPSSFSRIAGSRELSRRILTAAEQSDKQTIKRLIKQMGVRHEVDTVFNPDGIYISLIGTQSRIILALRWSEDRNHFASIRLWHHSRASR